MLLLTDSYNLLFTLLPAFSQKEVLGIAERFFAGRKGGRAAELIR